MMDAIAELTAEQGYEATKIADIVRRAAVARKTLYDNFDGKEDLFLSAVDATLTEDAGSWSKRPATQADVVGGPDRRRPRGLPRLHRRAPGASARMCMVEAISATPSSARLYDAGDARLRRAAARQRPARADLPETIEEIAGRRRRLDSPAADPPRRGRAGRASCCPNCPQFVLSPYLGVGKVGRYREAKMTVRWQTPLAEWTDYHGDAMGFRLSSSPEISASG